MNAAPNHQRLRQACRRGMLELDVLLGNFLEKAFISLSKTDQDTFIELLDESDQDLIFWLRARETPTNSKFIRIIEKIRDHAKNRHCVETLKD